MSMLETEQVQPCMLSILADRYSSMALLVWENEQSHICTFLPREGPFDGLFKTIQSFVGTKADALRCKSPGQEFVDFICASMQAVWPEGNVIFVGIKGTDAHYAYMGVESAVASATKALQQYARELNPDAVCETTEERSGSDCAVG